MGIADVTENSILDLIFTAVAWANMADNAAASPKTNIAYALHTADPTDSGAQNASEVTYTSYARVDVARTTGGHTVTANSVSPVANISFPAGTGGSGTATHFSSGEVNTGATNILYSGTVTPNIVTGDGITPELTTATTMTLD